MTAQLAADNPLIFRGLKTLIAQHGVERVNQVSLAVLGFPFVMIDGTTEVMKVAREISKP